MILRNVLSQFFIVKKYPALKKIYLLWRIMLTKKNKNKNKKQTNKQKKNNSYTLELMSGQKLYVQRFGKKNS